MKHKIIIAIISILIITDISIGSYLFLSADFSKADAKQNNFASNSIEQSTKTNIAPLWGTKNKTSANISATSVEVYKYLFISESPGEITLAPNETSTLWINLLNNGDTTWNQYLFNLGTVHPKDRDSLFATSSWLSLNRIAMTDMSVAPGETAHFKFEIKAPQNSGVYYEYFRPLVEGKAWLPDIGIYWKITVKNPNENESTLSVFNKPGIKKILISVSSQRLNCFEDGDIVCNYPISSGTYALPTPLGNFKVEKKRPVAYSSSYDLYMNWWMAFTPSEAYGIHELPYWKYSWGIITEGEDHLGIRVSHGCVRLGIGPAKTVYDWADIGTPVEIVN